jgi:hypothetical protein
VDLDNNTIFVGPDHGFKTGDAIIYGTGGGSAIGGLTDGETYYVIVDDPASGNIRISYTKAQAINGQAIDLTDNALTASNVNNVGAVTVSAKDSSEINTLAIGVSATEAGQLVLH